MLYRAKKKAFESIKGIDLAEKTCMAKETISRIRNGKLTTYRTAKVIVETINKNGKIEDYFEEIEP